MSFLLNPPSIGIVVLNYNQAKLTIDCVNSILKQRYNNYKVVIVDNNSPDLIQKEILTNHLPNETILILNPQNNGYAAGNNVGAKYCVEHLESDFIFILNNDTLLEDTDTIQNLVKTFEENVKIAAVSPLIYKPDLKIPLNKRPQVRKLINQYKITICNVILLSHLPFFKNIVKDYLYADLMPYQPIIYEVDSINGSAFMIRTSILKSINYLNEKTFLYSEELILGFQIKEQGKICGLNCKVIVTHFQGITTGNTVYTINWKMHKYQIDSFVVLLKDYYKSPLWLINFFKLCRILDFFFKKIHLWALSIFT